jgi:hypothetical protein
MPLKGPPQRRPFAVEQGCGVLRIRGAHWLDYNYLHDNLPRHAKVSITSALGKGGVKSDTNENRTTRIVGVALGFIFFAVLLLNAMS